MRTCSHLAQSRNVSGDGRFALIVIADYALRVNAQFVATGRHGTAGSGAPTTLVSSCTGAPGGSQIRALGRAPRQGTGRSANPQVIVAASPAVQPNGMATCEDDLVPGRVVPLRQSQRGGRGSRAPVSEPARPGNRARQSPTSAGSRTARMVPTRPAPASEPLRWRSRSRYRPVATAASPYHPHQPA